MIFGMRLCGVVLAVMTLFGVSTSNAAAPEAGVLPSTAQTSAALPSAAETPLYRAHECAYEHEGTRKLECGTLYVRENRSPAGQRVISLPIITFKSEARRPRVDPVIFVNGGPGAPSIADQTYLNKFWSADWLARQDWLVDRDFIVFDARGVGAAMPVLNCDDAPLDIELEDTSLRLEAKLRAMTACRDALSAQGIDLAAYNTLEVATDIHQLRQAMAIESWNLWGASYGTRAILEALRQDETGVRSVILAGTYPPGFGVPRDTAKSMDYVLSKIFRTCGTQRKCRRYFKDMEGSFLDTLASLRQTPLPLIFTDEASGEEISLPLRATHLLNMIFNLVYSREGVEIIPNLLKEVENRKPRFLLHVMSQMAEYEDYMASGTHMSIRCNDGAGMSEEVRQDRMARYPYLADWIKLSLDPRYCRIWNAAGDPLLDPTPVTSDLPVLLLAGEYDPVTPVYWAEAAAETLPNSQLFVFPGQTHSVDQSACAQQIMHQFINAPDKRPTHGCFAYQAEPVFSVR